MNDYKHRCLVRESPKIREILEARFKQLKLTGRNIVRDARGSGRKFNEQQLSRYRKRGNTEWGLSTSDVMWLCDRYNVEISLRAKRLKYTKGGSSEQ